MVPLCGALSQQRTFVLTNCVNFKGHLCTLVTVCARIAASPREPGAILHSWRVETGWHIPCIYERDCDRSPSPPPDLTV